MASASTGSSSNELETVAVGMPATVEQAPNRAGQTLGRYVVIGEAGTGGMGRVLRAYDPKLQREVALKILRPSEKSRDGPARIVREARALAKVSNPNVVAVYDVEVLDQEVVLAMEFVDGQTLRAWLKSERRPWQEVLDRFVAAGRGLAAAHAQGLLHRDFKPANVLVSSSGRVKVTDFGLAKADSVDTPDGQQSADSPDGQQRAGSSTKERELLSAEITADLTQAGTVMGTPRYMSPEQHAGGRLGPASDQYSFCVALWEALTGTPTFEGKHIASAKLRGPPTRPSSAAAPKAVFEALRRGLAVEPQRRWPDMPTLIETLAGQPPRRRRRLAALGFIGAVGVAAAVVSQLGGLGGPSECDSAQSHLIGIWDEETAAEAQAAIIDTGLSYAPSVWRLVDSSLGTYSAGWVERHTEACVATAVRGEQSENVMDLRMACLDRAKQRLSAVTRVLVTADDAAVQNADQMVGALPDLERCDDIDSLLAGVEPPTSQDAGRVEAIRGHLADANSLRQAIRFDGAQRSVYAAEAELAQVSYGPVIAEAALARGKLQDALGDYEDAALSLREALREAMKNRQWDVARDACVELIYITGALLSRPDEARAYGDMARGLFSIVPDDRQRLSFHLHVAGSLHREGKWLESEAEGNKAVELATSAFGARSERRANASDVVALALERQGKLAEAEGIYRDAVAILEEKLGADHPRVASVLSHLGGTLTQSGRYLEAESIEYRALEIRLAALGPDHPSVSVSRNNLAGALASQEKYAEAAEQMKLVLDVRERRLGPDHVDVAGARHNLGLLLTNQGKYAEAETHLRRAIAGRLEHLDETHPGVAASRTSLAHVLWKQERADEALPIAEKAWAVLQAETVAAASRGDAAFALARALWDTGGDRDRAREAALVAREAYVSMGEYGAGDVTKVKRWLRAHPE